MFLWSASTAHCIGVLDAETMAAVWDGGGPDRMRMPVSTVVGHQSPPRVLETDSVAATARAMLAARADFVAVIDADDRLVGLVTARDLVAAVAGQRHPAVAGSHAARAVPDRAGAPERVRRGQREAVVRMPWRGGT